MKVLGYFITAIMIAGLTLGISLAASNSKELAKGDGIAITDTDLKQRIEKLPERTHYRVDKEKLLNKMIEEELLIREAKRINLQDNEDYKRRMEAVGRDLLMEIYLQQYLKEKNTEENQKKYYEENKTNYKTPEMVRISVTRLKTEEEAQDILKKAQAGEDFAELARKHSSETHAQKGGDFGFRARKTLRKELGDVAFPMKKGELSGPVKAQDGYYIVKLTDRREEGIAKFEEVRDRVSSDYVRKLMEEKVSDLRKAANVQIDSAELNNLRIETGKGGEK